MVVKFLYVYNVIIFCEVFKDDNFPGMSSHVGYKGVSLTPGKVFTVKVS